MGAGDEVYGLLGLTANNSNSFTNWAAWDATLGITANFFGIYTYEIDGLLGPKGLLDITFDDPLPLGSIAVAWATDGTQEFVTAFTEAGGVIPEPATLLLFGAGLAGSALLAGRRRRKRST